MQDFVPLGTGNSRYLKSVENFKTLYPTYDAFVAALVAGTLPIDFNGINEAGIAQKGTPINGATLLKELTAGLYDLGITAVPDDVFRALSRFQKGLGNEYVWAKEGYIAPTYTQKTVDKAYLINAEYYITAKTADSFEVDESGTVSLVNPSAEQTITGGNLTALKGKYFVITTGFFTGSIERDVVYYCPAGTSFTSIYYGGANFWTPDVLYLITGVAAITDGLEYVNSPDPNAYPPAVDDGCRYTALGMLGEKTKIATGSYTGNGNHNSGSINSLTFDFEPKLVIIRTNENSGQNGNVYGATLVRHDTGGYLHQYNDTYGMYSSYLQVKWTGNTVYYYTTMGYPGDQLNTATVKYYYVAIG